MLVHIRELEKLLENNGVEVRPWQWPGYATTYPPGVTFDAMGNPVADPSSKDQWQQVGLVWVKNGGGRQKSSSNAGTYTPWSLPPSRTKDSYLGVSADSAPLSSIKGTTLSILGTTIDITSFDAPDMDEPLPGTPIGSPLYNKSVMAFFQSCLNINPPLGNVELPSKQDAFRYAEWYFLMIWPFLPILHKPSFFQLVSAPFFPLIRALELTPPAVDAHLRRPDLQTSGPRAGPCAHGLCQHLLPVRHQKPRGAREVRPAQRSV
jgi:hypothetical protein